ncbi:glycosylphosphatidylinositol anchor biosynthesis [Collariella sp. IMI 366227]|nr:glycosylphosphatidylinositol anchor biosynthesis [Collariella sp. IMI 366227]
MAPPSGLHQSAIPSDFDAPFPPLVRSSTVPLSLRTHRADPSHLAPEDACSPVSPPRRLRAFDSQGHGSSTDSRPHRLRRKDASRSGSRRRKRFQKLLWVKQSYPDNYTDQATFLENLQRNPRVRPYDFWPLVADSTVIVQHVCSVIIFVETQGTGSDEDIRARMMRDGRASREFHPPRRQDSSGLEQTMPNASSVSISSVSNVTSAESSTSNLLQEHTQPPRLSQPPTSNTPTNASGLLAPTKLQSCSVSSLSATATAPHTPDPNNSSSITYSPPARNSRAYVRASTIKSAILIYFTLLGLSPILKSLTRSTSSDSIWAMSFWLLALNVFFFDYSGSSWVGAGLGSGSSGIVGSSGGKKKMPVASLSTNAALMASTVLASRLPSTGQVFSLTLFSIEVFGLFPVFRQYARHRSWRYHVLLTVGGAVSWWLIGMQKYKNEIYGPWDPARPIIISRRQWDDE